MEPISLIVLFIVGTGAVIAEMFVPGMIIGICGVVCIITSIVMAYNADYNILGHVLFGCGVFSIPILLIIWYKVFSKTFTIKESEKGFSSSDEKLKDLLSLEGVAITPLHPSGIVLIDGKRIDVVTAGDMIEKNTKVKVIEVEGNRVVVRTVKS
ncbi:MAG: NfeD family protein [Candidatus Anammoxibacter sp.]